VTDHGSHVSSTSYCYRHPGRATRLACSECGRQICVDCSQDSAVGQKCPECAKPVGRNRVINARNIRQVDRATTPVTWALIAINAAIFVLFMLNAQDRFLFTLDYGQSKGAIDGGEVWRVFTAMFLHANETHILFNMWALYLFGPSLERRFGSLSFASLYLAAGLGGGALYHVVGRTALAVGASGAIFGLMGAILAATYRQRHTPAGRAVFSQLVLLLLINLSLPLILSNIAWEAHVGGLAAGIAIAAAWDKLPRQAAGTEARQVVVALVVGIVALGAVLFL
jgi:membrane associated rhomboid family serine protease